MAVSPLPEPDKGGFLNTIRGAAESLWGNLKRVITTPFEQTVSPLAGPDVTQTGPGTFRSVWGSPRPSASSVSVPTPTPTPPALSVSPQVLSGQSGRGRRADFDWEGATRGRENVLSAISQAANQFGLPVELLLDIAASESSLNPALRNPAGTDTGLFQFTDPTWQTVQNYMNMQGSTLNLPNLNRLDPLTSALAAAYLISKGQLGRWNPSQNKWGPQYSLQELEPFYQQTLPAEVPQANWR